MNRTEKSHINSAAITHPGMTGKNNEDRYGVSAFTLGDEVDTPVLLAVLSDGIGGHRAGEVASEMVVDLISRQIAASDGKSPTRTLEKAIHYASQQIYSRSQAESGRKGMGATVACAWVIGQRLYTATVGDSRIYLISQGKIHQVSTDHSWIQEAIEGGILTPEQAVGHPNAHVIRRYVGSPSPPEVDFRLKLNGEENESQSYSNQGMILEMVIVCCFAVMGLLIWSVMTRFFPSQRTIHWKNQTRCWLIWLTSAADMTISLSSSWKCRVRHLMIKNRPKNLLFRCAPWPWGV